MTNSKSKTDNFIETAIIQSNQMDAKKMIKEWHGKQDSPHADIRFSPEEIERIENETGADLSHLKGFI